MKKIKIFLASSEELEFERLAFGNLVRRLDNIYEKRGIRVELFEWEDYDAAYNGIAKQDEYFEQIKESDIFLALFHTRAGEFTVEEFNVATEEFRQKASPKVYVYCKDLQQDETELQELKDFKKRLFEELGYYWCRFSNRDTMQLHFVMQLQLVESIRMDRLTVKDNGIVTLDGMPVAHMNRLPFAAGNKDYQRISSELQELPSKIERIRNRLEKSPDDEDMRNDLQDLTDQYNHRKEELVQLQQELFSTAKWIVYQRQQYVSTRLLRAIEAFEAGNLERARILLEENEQEVDQDIERLEHHKKLLEEDYKVVHEQVASLWLQAKVVIADMSVPVSNRIKSAIALYSKAEDLASRYDYNKEKYEELLYDYAETLYRSSLSNYHTCETIFLRQIDLCKEIYGKESFYVALSYNHLGVVYYNLSIIDGSGIAEPAIVFDNLYKAKDCCHKSLQICLKDKDVSNINTFSAYMLLAQTIYEVTYKDVVIKKFFDYEELGLEDRIKDFIKENNYDRALEYYFKALDIINTLPGDNRKNIAETYEAIALVYERQGDVAKAEEYYDHASDIRDDLDEEYPDVW